MKRNTGAKIWNEVMSEHSGVQKPLLMGILNVTPDSFSDGGVFYKDGEIDLPKAVDKVLKMVEAGADIIDIGGESSGPDSKDVSLDEELKRVLPLVKALRRKSDILISVDTSKSEVARQALEVGADLINDVTALRGDPKMAVVLKDFEAPVIIMYSKDPTARTTRLAVDYDDVVKTISDFLEERIAFGKEMGIERERFILDPGMGAFVSMNPKYSLEILKRLREFKSFHLPILIGASRKGFIGQVLGKNIKRNDDYVLPVQQRLEGSLACAMMAMLNGASILRVHDVEETTSMVNMVNAIMNYERL